MYEQYTDKQIVEMLKPKLKKLGWVPVERYLSTSKMIATIYRSAYIRGQLGRSFIIGEKKNEEPVNTFKVGDKVKFLGFSIEDEEAWNNRWFYPPVNTVCKVIKSGLINCLVHWPKGVTAGDGVWACPNKYLEKVTERWVPATKDNVHKDSTVRFISKATGFCFPPTGTIGKIIIAATKKCYVQWPEGVTTDDDCWWCSYKCLEVLLCE